MTPQATKRLTLRDLAPLVDDYANLLSDWNRVRPDLLARVKSCFAQGVWFDRLRTGDYRATGFIRTLVAPLPKGALELPQLLSIRYRAINARRHPSSYQMAFDDMCSRFWPSPTSVLDPSAILDGYMERAIPKSYEALAIAAASAYMRRPKDAALWLSKFWELSERDRGDTDTLRAGFAKELRSWLDTGTAVEQLNTILRDQALEFEPDSTAN